MGGQIRFSPAVLSALCLAIAVLVVFVVVTVTTTDESTARQPLPVAIARAPLPKGGIADPDDPIEDGGLSEALRFMPPIHDPASLAELRDVVAARGRLGLAVLQAEFERIRLPFRAPKDQVTDAARILHRIGLLKLYEGRDREAADCFSRALTLGRPIDIPSDDRARRLALLGILAMRRGDSSDDPVRMFTSYLEEYPEDLRVRWLLNLAYLERGEYPDRVPTEHLVPLVAPASRSSGEAFEDIAPEAGLDARGPNLAGGSVFDDFDGDGFADLFTTSLGAERGASLFANRGDGTFRDASADAGLVEQVHAINASAADYDNDGDLDVVLIRGEGEIPLRPSLLRNRGDGWFDDVTIAAGLAGPIASRSAAWGDFDDDGRVDLFVCGEYGETRGGSDSGRPDIRNRCRLYRNRGDGTFVDVAALAGVENERFAQGAAWADYDGDGRLDLYVANRDAGGRLYHNEGGGRFRDVAPELGVTGPAGASLCGFWDVDDDGRPDLLVAGGGASLSRYVAAALGRPDQGEGHPRLYRNLGPGGFADVTGEAGLDRCLPAVAANFGDIDSDGDLDLYVATGWNARSGAAPGRMFRNDGGRFEDITATAGVGAVARGRSVSFADIEGDGGLDLFVECGGLVPGDASPNLLYRNRHRGGHWLEIRLVGTRTNRSAVGANIRVAFTSAAGEQRVIHRTVGQGCGTGGNSLTQSVGLGDAARVASLTIRWPTSRTTQVFRELPVDRAIEIVEGEDSYRVLTRAAAAASRGSAAGSAGPARPGGASPARSPRERRESSLTAGRAGCSDR